MAESKGKIFREDRDVEGILRVYDNLQLGTPTLAGTTRTFEVLGSGSDVGFTFSTKGAGTMKIPAAYNTAILAGSDPLDIVTKGYVDVRVLGLPFTGPITEDEDGFALVYDHNTTSFSLSPNTGGSSNTFASGVENVAGVVKLGGTDLDRPTSITTASTHQLTISSPSTATGALLFGSQGTGGFTESTVFIAGDGGSVQMFSKGDGSTTITFPSTAFLLGPSFFAMQHSINGSQGRSIILNASGMFVVDSIQGTGLQYDINYASTASTNPRWLPDVNYVKTTIGGKLISSLVTNPGSVQNNNFIAWDNSSQVYTLLPISAPEGYSTIQNAGGVVTQRTVINILNGLTAVDDSGSSRTTVKLGGPLSQATIIDGDDTHTFSIVGVPSLEMSTVTNQKINLGASSILVTLTGVTTFQEAADYSANYNDRSYISRSYLIDQITPDWIPEAGTSINISNSHNRNIVICTNVNPIIVTIPTGLILGLQTIVYRASGAGEVTIQSAGTLETAITPFKLTVQKTAAYINHKGSDVHVVLGGGTGAGGGGGTGVVTSVGLANITDFATASGTPINAGNPSGVLVLTLNTQGAGTFLAGPISGADAIPTNRSIVTTDLPNYEIVNTNGTGSFTLDETHNRKIIKVIDTGTCNISIASSLPTGWGTLVYRAEGAGNVVLSSPGTLESVGTTLLQEKTAASIFHNGSDLHIAMGALGSFTVGHIIKNNTTPLAERTNLTFRNGLTASDSDPDTVVVWGGNLTQGVTIDALSTHSIVFSNLTTFLVGEHTQFKQNAIDIGSGNTTTSSTAGFLHGTASTVSGTLSAVIGGETAVASGHGSIATGRATLASGSKSFAGGWHRSGQSNGPLASGSASFAFYVTDTNNIAGSGAKAEGSAILGGLNNNIESGNTYSAVIAGNTISLTGTSYQHHLAVSNLAIFSTPGAGDSNDVLTWDSTTKKIGKVTQASLGGAGSIDGSGAAGQVAFWSDLNTLTAEAAFAYNLTTNILSTDGIELGIAATTGTSRLIVPVGTEAHIDLNLHPKVNGIVQLGTDATGLVRIGRTTASGNRRITVGSASTNADLTIEPKGHGDIIIGFGSSGVLQMGDTASSSSARGIDSVGTAVDIVMAIHSKGAFPVALSNGIVGDHILEYYADQNTLRAIRSNGVLTTFTITGEPGDSTSVDGKHVLLTAGNAYTSAGDGNGGTLTLESGAKRTIGSGIDGNIVINPKSGALILTLPTSPTGLPSGAAYWNSNVLTRIP